MYSIVGYIGLSVFFTIIFEQTIKYIQRDKGNKTALPSRSLKQEVKA